MFELKTEKHIEFLPGQQLSCKPRLIISDTRLLLSKATTLEDFEKETTTSVGSVEDWLHFDKTDSFGFDIESQLLKLIYLYYPEQNKMPDNLSLFKKAERITGIPKLQDSEDFDISPFDYRYYSINDNLLLSFGEESSSVSSLVEMRIAQDVSLFFGDGLYCAWGIYNPELYLTDNFSAIKARQSSEFLKGSFKSAFDLISIENIDRMDEKDDAILNQIAILNNEIVEHKEYADNEGLSIIQKWLYDIADRFYSESDLQGLFKK
ncbi:MAG: hypothetical protein JWO09_2310 [Bacteroidetes bacterium]|nr:hypothetical protein [Bacteroidota bacterium]